MALTLAYFVRNLLPPRPPFHLMPPCGCFLSEDNFLCEDGWDPAFLNDCSRFGAEAGRLAVDATMGATRGEMAWVEPDAALESTFPALHELLLNLHALAYELNHKAPGLSLARPCRGKGIPGTLSWVIQQSVMSSRDPVSPFLFQS